MTSVMFLHGEEDIPEIVHALKSFGVAVIGCMRTRAPELRTLVSAALAAEKKDGNGVINLLLPLTYKGDVWDTTVFFYDAKHSYRPGTSIALVNRALSEWIAEGQIDYYLYSE